MNLPRASPRLAVLAQILVVVVPLGLWLGLAGRLGLGLSLGVAHVTIDSFGLFALHVLRPALERVLHPTP